MRVITLGSHPPQPPNKLRPKSHETELCIRNPYYYHYCH